MRSTDACHGLCLDFFCRLHPLAMHHIVGDIASFLSFGKEVFAAKTRPLEPGAPTLPALFAVFKASAPVLFPVESRTIGCLGRVGADCKFFVAVARSLVFFLTERGALCMVRAFSPSVWDILPGPPKETGEMPPEEPLEWKSASVPLTGAIFCPPPRRIPPGFPRRRGLGG